MMGRVEVTAWWPAPQAHYGLSKAMVMALDRIRKGTDKGWSAKLPTYEALRSRGLLTDKGYRALGDHDEEPSPLTPKGREACDALFSDACVWQGVCSLCKARALCRRLDRRSVCFFGCPKQPEATP